MQKKKKTHSRNIYPVFSRQSGNCAHLLNGTASITLVHTPTAASKKKILAFYKIPNKATMRHRPQNEWGMPTNFRSSATTGYKMETERVLQATHMDILLRRSSIFATNSRRASTTSGLLWPSTYTHFWCLDHLKPSSRIQLCAVLREIPGAPSSSSFSRCSFIHLAHSGKRAGSVRRYNSRKKKGGRGILGSVSCRDASHAQGGGRR